jgi:hypothetical protein
MGVISSQGFLTEVHAGSTREFLTLVHGGSRRGFLTEVHKAICLVVYTGSIKSLAILVAARPVASAGW